jgi:hypothetical protein
MPEWLDELPEAQKRSHSIIMSVCVYICIHLKDFNGPEFEDHTTRGQPVYLRFNFLVSMIIRMAVRILEERATLPRLNISASDFMWKNI